MALRFHRACGFALVLAAIAIAPARAQRFAYDDQFPNSIMAPERGIGGHHRGTSASKGRHRANPPSQPSASVPDSVPEKTNPPKGRVAVRGSSGVVLPTPLPKTQLIPPEGGSSLVTPNLSREHGPTFVPGVAQPVPNLPHGPETFQDRASRCSFQAGLYGPQGGSSPNYMGACLQ
jgi:hypothetical protein